MGCVSIYSKGDNDIVSQIHYYLNQLIEKIQKYIKQKFN